ncbi:helix-turn-helix domain-containing protein [Alkalibacter saccharofermentans]|nr:helix-turn-helix transcriptional regulator [Alkalibacter saccharofermentans]
MCIGEKIRCLREEKNMTQKQLAEILGISQQAVGKWEKGINEPDFETIVKLCDIFGVASDYILGRIETASPTPKEQIVELLKRPEFKDAAIAFQDYHDWTEDEIQSIADFIEGKRLLKEKKKLSNYIFLNLE